jgi:hypothetical protein
MLCSAGRQTAEMPVETNDLRTKEINPKRDGEMTVHSTITDRNARGRFVHGNDAARHGRTAKVARLQAKAEELASQFEGGLSALSPVDAGRIRLAAKNLLIAETSSDANEVTRCARAGEFLLAKVKPPEAAPKDTAFDRYVAAKADAG